MTNQEFALEPGQRDIDRDEWRWIHRFLRLQFRRSLRLLERAAGDARTLVEAFRRIMRLNVTTPDDAMYFGKVTAVVSPLRRTQAGGLPPRELFVSEERWSASSSREKLGILAWALACVGFNGSVHRPFSAIQFRSLLDVFGAPGAWNVVEHYIAARLLEANEVAS